MLPDAQELRAAQVELADSLRFSQHVLDNVADGIYGLDEDLRANFTNPSTLRMLGYTREQLLGQDLHAQLHRLPDGSTRPKEQCFAARALATGEVVSSDRELFRRADGVLLPVEAVAVPTTTGGAVSGVVVSFRDLTGRLAAEEQAEQLRVLAQREAVQRALSDGLQQALLTAPPEPPGLQIAVRYRPAAAGAQVGGDWYDAFVQPDGSTIVVIGDVVGHDTSAASAMAQLRGLLRGIAYASSEPPSVLLTRFETAAAGLGVQVMATTVVARVETASAAPGGAAHVVWSNAGHPPPVLLAPGGAVTVLRTPADLLLGIDAGTVRRDHEVDLPVGASLLLFTDGLVERRGSDLDRDLTALTEALVDLGAVDLDQLCEAILARLVPSTAAPGRAGDDDIALLAVRRS